LQVSKRANRVRSVHRYARLHCRGPDGACHARQRDRCYHFSEVASRFLANERLKVSQGLQLMGPTNHTESAPPSRNDDAQLLLRSALYNIHCLLFIFLIYIMYTLHFHAIFDNDGRTLSFVLAHLESLTTCYCEYQAQARPGHETSPELPPEKHATAVVIEQSHTAKMQVADYLFILDAVQRQSHNDGRHSVPTVMTLHPRCTFTNNRHLRICTRCRTTSAVRNTWCSQHCRSSALSGPQWPDSTSSC